MSRRILVTGGAGFIGSHVVARLLALGDRVTVLDSFDDFYDPALKRNNLALLDAETSRPALEVVEGDIRDRPLLDRLFAAGSFDHIVHLAARAGVRPSLERPELYFDVNCLGTLALLDAARKHGPPRLVIGSSSSIYGGTSRLPFAEDDPADRPISPYAVSKRSAELLCANYHQLYGLDLTCLRFFTVYGPAQRPEMAIHRFTEHLASGRPITLFGDGSSRRDYTYVSDIVAGIEAALGLRRGFEVINLGGAETTTLADLVRWLAAELAVEPKIEYLAEQPGDVPATYADISKAARLLSYNPRVPIRDGLRRFVSWYRANRGPNPPIPGG